MYRMNLLRGLLIAATVFSSSARMPAQDTADAPDPTNELAAVASPRKIQSTNVIITWTPSHDQLAGFSISRGMWKTIAIEPVESIVPVLGHDVACVLINNAVAAYSGTTGQWDVLPVSVSWQQLADGSWPVTVDGSLVQVHDGDHIYTFTPGAGYWSSPTNAEFQPGVAELTLKSANNLAILKEMQQWMHAQDPPIVANMTLKGTGQITVQANRRSWLKTIEDKLKELDSAGKLIFNDLHTVTPADTHHLFSTSADLHSRTPIKELRVQLQQVEQQAIAVAESLQDNPGSDDSERQRLARLVDDAFQLRQNLQLADVERMNARLQSIRATIESREKNRERIVQRRVDALLGHGSTRSAGDTRNQGSTATGEASASAETSAAQSPEAPIRQGRPPAVVPTFNSPEKLLRPSASGVGTVGPEKSWRDPVEIVAQLQSLRSQIVDHMQNFDQMEAQIAKLSKSKPLADLTDDKRRSVSPDVHQSQLMLKASEDALRHYKASLALAKAVWHTAWDTYQTQVHLLKLEVDEATVELQSLKEVLNKARAAAEFGNITTEQLTEFATRTLVAEIRLKRATEILKLYEDIATRNPQLNPASFLKTP